MFRLFGRRDQRINALGAKELAHAAVFGFWFSGFWFLVPDTRQPETMNQKLETCFYRFLWPFVNFFTRFFSDPRATPEARLGLGAAFLRDARFSFLRSVLSVIFFVFIPLGFLRISPPASLVHNPGSLQ